LGMILGSEGDDYRDFWSFLYWMPRRSLFVYQNIRC